MNRTVNDAMDWSVYHCCKLADMEGNNFGDRHCGCTDECKMGEDIMNPTADDPDIPASVLAMEDVGNNYFTPTAPLDDFIQAYRADDNWWWRISQGHQLNLFEAALERLGE